MTSFIGYINNAEIKLMIYFNSHKLRTSFLCGFMYLYRIIVHTNIKMIILFLYIITFFPEKLQWITIYQL